MLLGEEYHIILKMDHVPLQPPTRLISVKLKTAYKEDFKRLYDEGIIMPVQEHMKWTT